MKYKIQTYGCQMNVHDSEKLAGVLEKQGFKPANSANEADILVFNTCCIRATAEKKIMGNIGDVKHLKNKNKNLIFAVVGCMTQQEGMADTLKKHYPYIDIILGTANALELGEKVTQIANATAQKQKRKGIYETKSLNDFGYNDDDAEQIVRTSYPNAWITIMHGCNNFCSYCIVPYVRGREKSRDPHVILQEVRELLEQGYQTITFLGQNVNSYKCEKEGVLWTFASILEQAAQLPFSYKINFMTSHPKDFSDEVIDVIASCDNIEKKIHLPIQSGSNNVLKGMNRGYTRERYLDIIKKIRTKMPNCIITTDIMVGFPNETEEDFANTMNLVEEVRFNSAFTFIYSSRKGTEAAKMQGLSYTTKKARITKLVALQNKITKEKKI
jgi:tRNA-2-methylthio-N6-dimethylallyladenosine synthase